MHSRHKHNCNHNKLLLGFRRFSDGLKPPPSVKIMTATLMMAGPPKYLRGWADKFCFHCNIFIYIRYIWIKPVLCSRMVSLFHHTSPWTHRCLQSSHSAHRNGRVCRRSVQTACCYWILIRGKSSSNWNSQTNASRLWWSVCWCEYSKALGKVKCAVRKWVSKTKHHFLRTDFKNYRTVGGSVLKCWWFCRKIIMHLWK